VEVLKQNGFYTSNLCYIDGLKPYAGCRTCLVDVQGPPGLQLSCTSTVQDGMVVTTESDEVKDARKAVLAIILANHSDRCLTCHRREHCHPGDICLRDDVVTHRCLTCSKNYRCELQVTCEAVGMSGYEPWIGEERSFYQSAQPLADRANPFMEFDPQMCIICTRCQRACEEKRHTGAITLSGRGWDTQIAFGAGGPIHESNCDFSGACIDVCPTAALMEHPNKWVSKPDRWTTTTCDSCAVGCSLVIGSREGRGVIVRPGDGNPVSGDQICVRGRYHYDSLKPRERLSRHLVRRGQVHAPAKREDAVAEAARLLKEAAGRGRVGVLAGGTITNEEAHLVSRIAGEVFETSADTSLGPVMRAVRTALEARLGTWRVAGDMTKLATSTTIVVVADDLEESHNVASVRIKDAVVHHKAKLVVIGSLRSELVDFAACWVRPAGGEEGQAAAAIADGLKGAKVSGDIAAAVEVLRTAEPSETIVVCAPNPVSAATAGAMAGGAANLAVAIFGSYASENVVVLPAEVNLHGLQDQGVGLDGSGDPLAGLTGLLVVRDDPTLRLPAAVEALAGIGAVVVLDNVLHETAKRASVVIAEGRAYGSDGTYTQGDFRVQKLARAIKPEGDAVDLFSALRELGVALGVADLPADPDAALGAIARANPAYEPAWDMLIGEGVRMSVPGSGKGTIVPVEAANAPAGLRVVSGRDLYTAADAAALRHPEADKLHRYDRLQVSERDAANLGIADGDEVEVGGVRVKASVTERVATGTVFASSLLQGGLAARLLAMPSLSLARAGAPAAAPPRPAFGSQPGGEAPDGDVWQITGLEMAAKLRAIDIRWVRDLLAQGGSPDGRREIAARAGAEASTVLRWVNLADLMRIPGVTVDLADLLETAGVDTVKELAARRPDNLARKLAETAESAGRAWLAPAEATVTGWVDAAQGLSQGVTH
jgi:formate dehydrogenase major subunit